VSYQITLAPAAARQLRKLDPQARRRIQAVLELLADEPRPRDSWGWPESSSTALAGRSKTILGDVGRSRRSQAEELE
jgi:mRNA-degrading endonuclease RelE of RelBE toxin-antitoxin system